MSHCFVIRSHISMITDNNCMLEMCAGICLQKKIYLNIFNKSFLLSIVYIVTLILLITEQINFLYMYT